MKTRIELRKIWIYCWLVLSCSTLSAQNNAIKNTKTDKKYANTTEVYKKDGATDTDVLGEISSDYGLGDVVRISVAPPPPPPVAELDKAKPISISSNNMPNMPNFGTPNMNIPTIKDNGVNEAPETTTPNAETSTYTNSSKDNINNNTPSVVTEKMNTSSNKDADMLIVSAKIPKKVSGDLPPPVFENGVDMSSFDKKKKENVVEKQQKSTSVKVSGNTKMMKNNSVGSRNSYTAKSHKKSSWFSFFGKKTMKPARRKSSRKETGCYKF